MNILDRFTSIDDLLVTLLERIGSVTEEDTHFFSYPNDGTRATITKGTTTLDFMSGTVMTPAGVVSNLGNSLRARGREYCRSLSLQADRDIIIQIGTKSKIPVFAGTWFKVAHLRFTDVKIVAAEDTRIFAIACTNPDAIDMAGESYARDPVDVWGQIKSMGNAELAVRNAAPPMVFDRRGDIIRWIDFESSSPSHTVNVIAGAPTRNRSTEATCFGDFSYKLGVSNADEIEVRTRVSDFHVGRLGCSVLFSSDLVNYYITAGLAHYTGATFTHASVKYDRSTQKLSYMDDGGGYVEIATIECVDNSYTFSTIKIVADFTTGKYVRALCLGNEYDLSDKTMYSSGSAITRQMKPFSDVKGTDGNPSIVYINNMVLTENEPL